MKNVDIFKEHVEELELEWFEEKVDGYTILESYIKLTQGKDVGVQIDFGDDDKEINITIYDYIFCADKSKRGKLLEMINDMNCVSGMPKVKLEDKEGVTLSISDWCYDEFNPKSVVENLDQLIGMADYYYTTLKKLVGKSGGDDPKSDSDDKVIQLFQ